MTSQLQYIGINTNLVCLGISCGGYHLSVPPSSWVNEGNSNFWLVQFSIETATAFWKHKRIWYDMAGTLHPCRQRWERQRVIILMSGPEWRERELQLPVITWYGASQREDNEDWAASCKSANYIENLPLPSPLPAHSQQTIILRASQSQSEIEIFRTFHN